MPQMKGMKELKLLVQRLETGRYGGVDGGRERKTGHNFGPGTLVASLAISAFFINKPSTQREFLLEPSELAGAEF
jgi:hypothetical protein